MYTAGVVEFSQSNGVPYTSVPNLQNRCNETIVRIASPCVILISFLASSIFFSFLYLIFYKNFTNPHFSNPLKQYSCHKITQTAPMALIINILKSFVYSESLIHLSHRISRICEFSCNK